MKTYYLILLITFPLIVSCAGQRVDPRVVNGRTYIDSTIPKTKIEFPFDVTYESADIDYSEAVNCTTHKLVSKGEKTTIFISKTNITMSSYEFLGTDVKKIKNQLFLERKKTDFCSVDIHEYNLTSFLRGVSYRYIGNKQVTRLIIYKHIGYISSEERFIAEKKHEISKFIENIQLICAQNKRI